MPSLIRAIAALEAAWKAGGPALEETTLEFAGSVLSAAGGLGESLPSPSPRDERRITEALRWIEKTAHDLEGAELSVGRLAREVGMSAYHFLRTFRNLVRMTPHQYLLHVRMNRAAVRLRLSDEPISSIAYEAGFNDLSTFNRRFRRLIGASPGAYRKRGA
jgi:AraC-like DNA-binding protein